MIIVQLINLYKYIMTLTSFLKFTSKIAPYDIIFPIIESLSIELDHN